jgi:hypothetical protein
VVCGLVGAALLSGQGLGSKPRFILVLYPGGKSGQNIAEKAGTDVEVTSLPGVCGCRGVRS